MSPDQGKIDDLLDFYDTIGANIKQTTLRSVL